MVPITRERRVRWGRVLVFSLSGVTVGFILVLGGRVFKSTIKMTV
jgi:hypothetical protein